MTQSELLCLAPCDVFIVFHDSPCDEAEIDDQVYLEMDDARARAKTLTERRGRLYLAHRLKLY